jgi:CheY-like chemotaxis protein
MHILLVDDDDDLREVLADVLREHGLEVSVARHGLEALEMLRGGACRPSLILLDLTMPKMGGAEFRRVQLADDALRAIPVFLMTAWGDVPEREALQPARSFRKPVDTETLLAAISEHVARTR